MKTILSLFLTSNLADRDAKSSIFAKKKSFLYAITLLCSIMKINTFEFEDKFQQWKLSKTRFEKLILLVGASGVGKTRTLEAIHALKIIAKGESLNGLAWKVNFSTIKGNIFEWEGEFESIPLDDLYDLRKNKSTPKILFEKIYKENKLLVDRQKDRTVLEEQETIKLKREKSLLNLLGEDFINEMKSEIEKIRLDDFQKEAFKINSSHIEYLAKEYNTLKKIRQSDLDIRLKMSITCIKEQKTFLEIKDRFIELFPQVEDVKN